MKELMIHVEKIVRPIRAFAGRKLRMRQELLSHLQAALEEERGSSDDAAALDRAKARLGVPAELTRSLQLSVPRIERMLMARLPLPGSVERWEARSVPWPRDFPITMLQSVILSIGSTALLFAACLSPAMGLHFDRTAAQRTMVNHPRDWMLLNIAAMIITFGGFAASVRFTAAVAGSGRRMLRNAIIVVFGPPVTMMLILAAVNQRAATPAELFRGVIVGFIVLGLQTLMGQLIGTLRRPYAQWLTLDIAQ